MGSGGGSTGGSGAGGALLRITAVGATLNGTILVGGNGAPAGGGAGGTLFIQANTIFGSGTLDASGGGIITPNTGGGGGGLHYPVGPFRILLHGYGLRRRGHAAPAPNSAGANGLFTQTGY